MAVRSQRRGGDWEPGKGARGEILVHDGGKTRGAASLQGLERLLVKVFDGRNSRGGNLLRLEEHQGIVVVRGFGVVKIYPAGVVLVFHFATETKISEDNLDPKVVRLFELFPQAVRDPVKAPLGLDEIGRDFIVDFEVGHLLGSQRGLR